MKREDVLVRCARILRRLARFSLLFVLLALLIVPAASLPFADRLRVEWTRFRNPAPSLEEPAKPDDAPVAVVTIRMPRAYGRVYPISRDAEGGAASSLRFSEAQEMGEMAGSLRTTILPRE